MAKLLVAWTSRPGVGVKQFDVVDVRDDSVEWGAREGLLSGYLRVSLPGVSREQALFLMDAEFDPLGRIDPDTGKGRDILTARAWKIVEARITPPILAQIEAAYMVSGEYVVQNADGMLAWLEKKIDGSRKGRW